MIKFLKVLCLSFVLAWTGYGMKLELGKDIIFALTHIDAVSAPVHYTIPYNTFLKEEEVAYCVRKWSEQNVLWTEGDNKKAILGAISDFVRVFVFCESTPWMNDALRGRVVFEGNAQATREGTGLEEECTLDWGGMFSVGIKTMYRL